MADEPQKKPDDIQGILSDLDDILSDLGSASAPAPAPPPKPVELPKLPLPPPPTPVPQAGHKIELAPREEVAPKPTA
ncbi:MAG: hypothetical protein AAB262_01815, partial [Elusimicrobiota bacterium]